MQIKVIQWVRRYEWCFFAAVILVHLFPLFSARYFVTVDGPAHLYNANLIKNIFLGHGDIIKQYFHLNPNPEPNWIGHLMQAILLVFVPAYLAEKILLIAYVVLLPVSFRLVGSTVNHEGRWASYLIFPFIYNLPLCFGFYNFSLGLPVFFFGIYVWNTSAFTEKKAALFFMLVVIAYFSHLYTCLFLIMIAFFRFVQEWFSAGNSMKLFLQQHRTRIAALLFSGLPVMVMTLLFIYNKGLTGYNGKMMQMPITELLTYIKVTRPLICWIYEPEKDVAIWMSRGLLAMLIVIVYNRFRKVKHGLLNRNDFWLACSLGFLVLFFLVPDTMFSGGFISIRMLLYFYLVLLLWIGCQEMPKPLMVCFIVLSLAVSLKLMRMHVEVTKGLSGDAAELAEVADHVEENSNLLPLNYSENWLHLNLSNYAGAVKKIIVMDNYEAHYPQFPLRWNEHAMPYELLGNFASSKRPCLHLDPYEKVSGIKINYILRWQAPEQLDDSCSLITGSLISKQFELSFVSSRGNAKLYRRK